MRNNNQEFEQLIRDIEANNPKWDKAQVSEELVNIVQAKYDSKCNLLENLQGYTVDTLMLLHKILKNVITKTER